MSLPATSSKYPLEQRLSSLPSWAALVRARGFGGSWWRVSHTANVAPARSSFSPKYTRWPQGGHLLSAAAAGQGAGHLLLLSKHKTHQSWAGARRGGAPGKHKECSNGINGIIRVDNNIEFQLVEEISFLWCAWINTIQIQESLSLRSPHCKLNFSINMSLISPHKDTWSAFSPWCKSCVNVFIT